VNRRVRRLAFYGYLGSGNIGNDATLETALAWLKSNHPEVEVQCITIAPSEIAARYRISARSLAWGSSAQDGHRLIRAARKLLGRLVDVPRSYALAGRVDAVIVPGMGVLEETLGVRPWGLPLWLLLIAGACRVRSRPFVLLDVGAERAGNPITRWLNVATVRLSTHVSYRDPSSAAAMASAGARSPEAIAPDLAFAHPASTLAKPEPGRLVVGVMAYYGPGDDPIRGADVRRRYVAAMARAMAHLARSGDRVVLVGGDRVDIAVAREIKAAVLDECSGLAKDAVLVREFTTFSELTSEMMRADTVIASRFHNLICTLRLARPTVSIGYAEKNRHLMQTLGLEDYCQDIDQLDEDRLIAQVQSARDNSELLSAAIRRGTSDYANDVDSLLERVAVEALGLPARAGQKVDLSNEVIA
jgi:polysaccharide pyruvyl transferase WcaK-like protein